MVLLRLVACILALNLVSTFGIAQNKRNAVGFVVQASGDSLKGVFNTKSMKPGVGSLLFTSRTGQTYTFTPSDVSAYGTDTLRYETLDITGAGKRMFFQTIGEGVIDLYLGPSSKLFVKTDTSNRLYRLSRNNVLYFLMRSCPNFRPQIKKANLEIESQIELFKAFHRCVNQGEFAVKLPEVKPRYFRYSALMGYGSSKIALNQNSEMKDINFRPSWSPQFGLGVDYFHKTRLPRFFSVSAQVWVTQLFFQGSHEELTDSNFTFTEVKFKHLVGRIPFGFRLQYPTSKSSAFFWKAGLVFQFNIYQQNSSQVLDFGKPDDFVTTDSSIPLYARQLLLPYVAIGGEARHGGKIWTVELRYDYATYPKQKMSAMQLTVGYLIGSNKQR